MDMTTICPSCHGVRHIDAEFAGHDVRCGQCGTIYTAVAAPESGEHQSLHDASPFRRRGNPQIIAAHNRARGSGVAALVIGIIALLTWWCPPVGLIAGSLAVILGCTSLQSTTRSLAVAGIVLGIASVMFSLGCGVIYGIAVSHQQELDQLSNGNQPPFADE